MVQLKIKTEYSFGQTYAPLARVIDRLKSLNCTAAGIVDHSTWGHVHWHAACREAGIKPLLGAECIVSDDDRPLRMWFLAKNQRGLSELYDALSMAHRQPLALRGGSKPRLYPTDISLMTDDILKFAGDVTNVSFLANIDAFCDLSPSSKVLNRIKGAFSLPTVGVSDNAYAFPEDKKIFEITSRAGTKITPQHILEELEHQDIARQIADLCEEYDLPKAPTIKVEGDLEALAREGAKKRDLSWSDQYEERLQYELTLIRNKNFGSYFLVVANMVHFAKQRMLVGPSRGSAAGSLVCYLTGITEIDPLPAGLFFERFIDINREDLPDIDLDFPDNKREMIFQYMRQNFGNVSHIGNINRFKPKSALVQACKALHIPPQATSSVKYAIIQRSPADARFNFCLEDTFKETDTGKSFVQGYPEAAHAARLEGHASHSGVHAAGMLVCNEVLTSYATVDKDGIAHIEKKAAEALGLLKIDVLGLRTLTILEDSGVDIDWYNLPLDDPKTYDIFNSGKLCGIFQFEGGAMRNVSRDITFKTIEDIDAVTALARPGPLGGGIVDKYIKRKKGETYDPIHPLVEKHMAKSYGLPIYQEQVLAIVREIGQFDWKDATAIRKAMGRSLGLEFFESYWVKFLAGATAQGISERDARKTWEMISSMGSWTMNRAHTYSYAVISYWTAYLKAHHPLEFAAANLRNAKSEDSAIELLREMVQEGMQYEPFDIGHSQSNWSVHNGKLLGGFTALKGIAEKKAAKLIEKRERGELTHADVDKDNTFADIFPFKNRYGHLYDDPQANGIGSSQVTEIKSFDEAVPMHRHEAVFLGELLYKKARNMNEEVNIKKRGGKVEQPPLEYVDVRLRDDTGTIGGRIARWDFDKIGKQLLDDVPTGAHLMIRAAFYNDIRYAFIKKWKRIDV